MRSPVYSTEKKNIRFVALGFFSQIEIYELHDDTYLSIYGSSPESPNNLDILLNHCEIEQYGEGEYAAKLGLSTVKLKILPKGKQFKCSVRQYIWGWLPVKWYSGKISSVGKTTLENELKKYVC